MVASSTLHTLPTLASLPITLPDVHILVVEDDPQCLAYYHRILTDTHCHVTLAPNGASVLPHIRTTPPDLILLDLHLPDIHGFALCQQIRTMSRVPIIVISGLDDEATKVAMLAVGADDYLVKPVGVRELPARIATVLRRVPDPLTTTRLEVGILTIDRRMRTVMRAGKNLSIAPNEWNLLLLLAQAAGEVVLHSTLIATLWPNDPTDRSATLHTTIKTLRKKIDLPGQPSFIRAVPRVGYCLNAA
jgi:DNA-binding response OmpR family regulator